MKRPKPGGQGFSARLIIDYFGGQKSLLTLQGFTYNFNLFGALGTSYMIAIGLPLSRSVLRVKTKPRLC